MQVPWENGFLPGLAHWFSFQPSPQLASYLLRSTPAGRGLVLLGTPLSIPLESLTDLWVSVWLLGECGRGGRGGSRHYAQH